MRTKRRDFVATVTGLTALGLSGCTSEDGDNGDYPSESIRVIMPYSSGGGGDTAFRNLQPVLEDHIGVDLEIENIPGAGTLRGQSELAQSEADGYTTLATANPGLPAAAMIEQPDDFNPEEFVAIATVASTPLAQYTHPDDEVEGYEDMISRFESGDFETLAVVPNGSAHLANYVARETHGLDYDRIVSASGSSDIAELVAGGEADVGCGSIPSVLDMRDDGLIDIPVILHSSGKEMIDDVPTPQDEGFESIDFIGGVTRSLVFPSGTSEEIAETLSDSTGEAMSSDEADEVANDIGLNIDFMDHDETQELWDNLFDTIPELVDFDELENEAQ